MTFIINSLVKSIAHQLNVHEQDLQVSSVSGGSINQTAKISVKNGQHLFIKINNAQTFPHLFLKEKAGLQLLQQQNIFTIPNVIHHFEKDNLQILILEWINSGDKTSGFWESFGKKLAELHFVTAENFGLDEDNYMGSVVQKNKISDNWVQFFINQRLAPVIKMCTQKSLLSAQHISKFQKLYTYLPSIYNIEKPSLLHGDLWSGNYMCNQNNQPVLIDPAVYFGHRSIDIGMTTLFGGFDKVFYQAYQYHYPLTDNYKEQWQVSNLYPLLIHLLLFGKSYLPQIDSVLNTYQ